MNKKGFCVAPFRNAEFLANGEVWQCVSGGWSESENKLFLVEVDKVKTLKEKHTNLQIFTNF